MGNTLYHAHPKTKRNEVIFAAFLHANIEERENIFMEMLFCFKKKGSMLKLKKTLHALHQVPHAFWMVLLTNLK